MNKLNFKKYDKKLSFFINWIYKNATKEDFSSKFYFLHLAWGLWKKERIINNHSYFILKKIINKANCNNLMSFAEFEKTTILYLKQWK